VQRSQESGETCLPQVLNEDRRTVQQVLTLCKDSRASSGPMRGIFCLFRPRFPVSVSGILVPLSRRPGWFRVVRPRELPELWTAHYKGQQICGFCGLRYDPDNATVRRGSTTREGETSDSERLAG